MDSAPLLLIQIVLSLSSAIYTGPLLPEISNGTFHHFFVPDGDYEDTEDPENCQMLFKFLDVSACGSSYEDSAAVVRDDFIITKHQIEDTARLLESIGRTIEYDLDGEDSYGKFLRREISQISEVYTNVETSLSELEVKFKQSQETNLREEHQLNGIVVKPINDVRDAVREITDISLGLKYKNELLSLVVRSHGTRLSRLKTEYIRV